MTTLREDIVKILDRANQNNEIQGVTVLKIANLIKHPKDKPPLLSDIKRDDYFQNELEWLYQRLASDVEALVPENLQDNVRWIIKDNFGKAVLEAQREADIKFYS